MVEGRNSQAVVAHACRQPPGLATAGSTAHNLLSLRALFLIPPPVQGRDKKKGGARGNKLYAMALLRGRDGHIMRDAERTTNSFVMGAARRTTNAEFSVGVPGFLAQRRPVPRRRDIGGRQRVLRRLSSRF
jgi:hypothetical protein